MDFVTEDVVPNSSTVSNHTDSVTIDPTINFLFRGIGILLLALFGIPTNLLSVAVLSHPKLRSSITTLLLGLTISDIFVIGACLLIFSVSKFNIFSSYTTYLWPHLVPWLWIINCIAQMSSRFFTAIITLERYIAVSLPLRSRLLCTRSAAQKSALIVVLVSILYNIPRMFEYQAVPVSNPEGLITYKVRQSEFWRSNDYIVYYVTWCDFVLFILVPVPILVYFNTAIYLVIKKQRSQRNTLSPTMASNQKEDIQLAGMLFGIVITSIICNVPITVIYIMGCFGIDKFWNVYPISNFLIVCNSSVNFVFYCVFGTEFRRRLKQTLRITPSDDNRKSSCVSYVTSTSIDLSNSVTTLGSEQHQKPVTSLPNSSTRV